MYKVVRVFAPLLLLGSTALAETAQERLKEASSVFTEIMSTEDKGIPKDLLEQAHCVVIVPNMKKAAFVVGGQYGRGFATCRTAAGGFGAPTAVRLEAGSVGFQIGAESTDLVMIVRNEKGMSKLLEDKFTLGADATVAAGPVGRSAAAKTDAQFEAEILAWSRSKGLFAGIGLSGMTVRNDLDENAELYGSKLTSRQVLTGSRPVPAAAQPLIGQLNAYSPSGKSTNADRVVK